MSQSSPDSGRPNAAAYGFLLVSLSESLSRSMTWIFLAANLSVASICRCCEAAKREGTARTLGRRCYGLQPDEPQALNWLSTVNVLWVLGSHLRLLEPHDFHMYVCVYARILTCVSVYVLLYVFADTAALVHVFV